MKHDRHAVNDRLKQRRQTADMKQRQRNKPAVPLRDPQIQRRRYSAGIMITESLLHPFGLPVVPDVYIRVAVSSSVT